jgi:hypothetical protein
MLRRLSPTPAIANGVYHRLRAGSREFLIIPAPIQTSCSSVELIFNLQVSI